MGIYSIFQQNVCSGDCCVCGQSGKCRSKCGEDGFYLADKDQIIERLDAGSNYRWSNCRETMKQCLIDNFGYDYDKEKEKDVMKNKKFTRDDLKVGYVVKLRDGRLCMVAEIGNKGSLILVCAEHGGYDYVSRWNTGLTFNSYAAYGYPKRVKEDGHDIVEVYGHINNSTYYDDALNISTDHRPLLWSRETVKKMTVSEIEKKLGYKIEVVAE